MTSDAEKQYEQFLLNLYREEGDGPEETERHRKQLHKQLAELKLVQKKALERLHNSKASLLVEALEKSPPTEEEAAKLFENELPPQAHYEIDDQMLGDAYQVALEEYAKKGYDEASGILLLLVTLNPSLHNAWTALGLCRAQMGLHEEAMDAYKFAGFYCGDEITVFFHAAESLMALKREPDARMLLDAVLQQLRDKSASKELISAAQSETKKILNT